MARPRGSSSDEQIVLARTVGDRETERLAAALIRARLARDFDDIAAAAGAMSSGRRG